MTQCTQDNRKCIRFVFSNDCIIIKIEYFSLPWEPITISSARFSPFKPDELPVTPSEMQTLYHNYFIYQVTTTF